MKFLRNYLVGSLLFLGLLTSCGSDDDSNTGQQLEQNEIVTVESNLEGEWNLVGFITENGMATGSLLGQNITAAFTQSGINFDYAASFNTNPNTISAEGTFSITTEITALGQTITEVVEFDSDNFNVNLLSGEWELLENGTILSTTSGDIMTTATIVSFSDNEIVYSLDLTQDALGDFVEETFDIQGASVEITGGTSIVTLRR